MRVDIYRLEWIVEKIDYTIGQVKLNDNHMNNKSNQIKSRDHAQNSNFSTMKATTQEGQIIFARSSKSINFYSKLIKLSYRLTIYTTLSSDSDLTALIWCTLSVNMA